MTASEAALIETYNVSRATRLPVASLDPPAIIIKHPSVQQNVDIVPAFLESEAGGKVLMMPGFDGDWIRSTPQGHAEVIGRADVRSGERLRPLIRFLKAWKYGNQIPVISFFLECVAYWYSQELQITSYGKAMEDIITTVFFDMLENKDGFAILNPLHPEWGPVTPFAQQNRGIIYEKIVQNVPCLKAGNELALEGETERAALVWNKAFGVYVSFP